MAAVHYRAATDLEYQFLKVVTRGFPELAEQVERCEVAEYDPTGWCCVRVTCGPSSPIVNPASGPTLKTDDPDHPFVEILLWTNGAGSLERVEIVDYGPAASIDNPYTLFVEAAKRGRLKYRFNETKD
jgi:hypothetical protein